LPRALGFQPNFSHIPKGKPNVHRHEPVLSGVFFEESAEHLDSMERPADPLDLDAPDPDQLNAIFLFGTFIKGGSGTFGFKDMTEVTHILETLLDGIPQK